MTTREYNMWFRILLLSKVENNHPLPFRGTTNFFRYKTLKEMEDFETVADNLPSSASSEGFQGKGTPYISGTRRNTIE
ncbi:MAG TPA: hypothetical protein EYH21_03450 [Methanothermococcus okinawensis]|uniref:Uncharacterized protein n=1 Tax=Methanothermococcus okinawensis TaxID=155863 RepID=A0A833E551_9EURY|nr:hypothetical protein [Methanothermococcus okinawensis]